MGASKFVADRESHGTEGILAKQFGVSRYQLRKLGGITKLRTEAGESAE